MDKIMIIEDDGAIREELLLLLKNAGYDVYAPEEFLDILSEVATYLPNLILLDVGLPGTDGFSVCRAVRKEYETPIIFVTSQNTSMDELRALSLGGDDFVAKPYNIAVLLARISAILRRSHKGAEDTLEVREVKLHLAKGTVSYHELEEELTKNEIRILHILMSRPGEIVSRLDIIEDLWDNQMYVDDNALSVNIGRLREKLSRLGLPEFIETKRGMGYKV